MNKTHYHVLTHLEDRIEVNKLSARIVALNLLDYRAMCGNCGTKARNEFDSNKKVTEFYANCPDSKCKPALKWVRVVRGSGPYRVQRNLEISCDCPSKVLTMVF